MTDPRINDELITQYLFGGIHFLYFVIYYSRYSTLNQRLSGIDKMEKAGVVDQHVIDTSRTSINKKIKKMRSWSYYPVIPIAIIHFVSLMILVPKITKGQMLINNEIVEYDVEIATLSPYWPFAFITLGSFAFIIASNYIKGAQIIDPNRRYGRFSPWRW